MHAGAGNPAQASLIGNKQLFYNGWSSFNKLKNNEPPLVIAYSTPLKIKLTNEVIQLTEKMCVHMHAYRCTFVACMHPICLPMLATVCTQACIVKDG